MKKPSLGGITPINVDNGGGNPLNQVFTGVEIPEFDQLPNSMVPIMVTNTSGTTQQREKRIKRLEKARQALLSATFKLDDLILETSLPTAKFSHTGTGFPAGRTKSSKSQSAIKP
jgi:hypothetical protein